MRVVVDTNVAFSALAAGCGDLAMRLLSPAELDFYAPRFLFIELFKHKAPSRCRDETAGGEAPRSAP